MSFASFEGAISTPVSLLADMISRSSTWQSWVGTTKASEAKQSVHIISRSAEDLSEQGKEFRYPYVQLTDPAWRYGGNPLNTTGQLELTFCEKLLQPGDEDQIPRQTEEEISYRNKVAGVLNDVLTEAIDGNDTYDTLVITLGQQSIALSKAIMRSRFTDRSEILCGSWTIDYGLRG